MRQVLGPGALGRPRGIGWGGRREGGSGWGTHVNPWLIHVNVWQKPPQYCKVISHQLIKNKEKKKRKDSTEVSQKLKIDLSYDLAIPLLGVFLDKGLILKDTCIATFIAALFTIAKT